MTVAATHPTALTKAQWRLDIAAGAIAGILGLPICLSVGVLVFLPLGPGYVAAGAAAGIVAAIVAGAVAAIFGTSSFVVTAPRASASLVLSTLIASLLLKPAFSGDPPLMIMAAALCLFLAGLWQILFGVFRVARVIKFTPHPVFAGFVNGAALLIIKAQIAQFFIGATGAITWRPHHLVTLVYIVGMTLFAVYYGRVVKRLALPAAFAKIPGALAVFIAGSAAYYALHWLDPALDLGPTVGPIDMTFAPPLLHLFDGGNFARIVSASGDVALISLVLAIVSSLEGLMAFRVAQNLTDLNVHPVRDLAAQGLANGAAALFSPVATAASPVLIVEAFRAGGRTRLTGLAASSITLIVGVAFSDALAGVPSAVLAAVLAAAGIAMVDGWSLRLIGRLFQKSASGMPRRDLYDALVVIAVMGITAATTVVIGVIAGILLAAVVFVINMSRPVVRRTYLGHEIFSKRTRSSDEIGILQKTGHRRAVLQLEGVLFFGNAEDLSRHVKQLFEQSDIVVLDLRGVSDIDASGSTILGALIKKSHALGKHLLFCNVAPAQDLQLRSLYDRAHLADAALMVDLETALEWSEEEILRSNEDARSLADVLPLEQIDFLKDFSQGELAELRPVLKPREFAAGEAICREGDPGDRLWLLAKGSASIRLAVNDQRGSRRIASLGRGTVVGEMALIDGARRSASIVADEPIVCYELCTEDLERLPPAIAAKIMRSIARELARRLRRTSEDLRHATS